MNHANGWMTDGWMNGGAWIMPVIGLLIVVLVVVLITKVSSNKS